MVARLLDEVHWIIQKSGERLYSLHLSGPLKTFLLSACFLNKDIKHVSYLIFIKKVIDGTKIYHLTQNNI